jgi:hypothetical protein
VHKYFNPYDSPYECFMAFMNIMNDMMLRVKEESPILAGSHITPAEWIKV